VCHIHGADWCTIVLISYFPSAVPLDIPCLSRRDAPMTVVESYGRKRYCSSQVHIWQCDTDDYCQSQAMYTCTLTQPAQSYCYTSNTSLAAFDQHLLQAHDDGPVQFMEQTKVLMTEITVFLRHCKLNRAVGEASVCSALYGSTTLPGRSADIFALRTA